MNANPDSRTDDYARLYQPDACLCGAYDGNTVQFDPHGGRMLHQVEYKKGHVGTRAAPCVMRGACSRIRTRPIRSAVGGTRFKRSRIPIRCTHPLRSRKPDMANTLTVVQGYNGNCVSRDRNWKPSQSNTGIGRMPQAGQRTARWTAVMRGKRFRHRACPGLDTWMLAHTLRIRHIRWRHGRWLVDVA